MKKLQNKYNKIVEKYIKLFKEKHNLEDSFSDWVGINNIGTVFCISDMYFDFVDIRFDIDNDIEKDKIIEWYHLSVDAHLENKKFPNFKNWLRTKDAMETLNKVIKQVNK